MRRISSSTVNRWDQALYRRDTVMPDIVFWPDGRAFRQVDICGV